MKTTNKYTKEGGLSPPLVITRDSTYASIALTEHFFF